MSAAKHTPALPLRAYITKSRSGHYTATIRDARGVLVDRLVKSELHQARAFVAKGEV